MYIKINVLDKISDNFSAAEIPADVITNENEASNPGIGLHGSSQCILLRKKLLSKDHKF